MTEIDIQSPPGRREMPEKEHIRMERMTAGSMPTIQKNVRNDVFNMPSPTNQLNIEDQNRDSKSAMATPAQEVTLKNVGA